MSFLRRFWSAYRESLQPHPLPRDVEMRSTAACANGRHWNCSGTASNFVRRWPCACPHHHPITDASVLASKDPLPDVEYEAWRASMRGRE